MRRALVVLGWVLALLVWGNGASHAAIPDHGLTINSWRTPDLNTPDPEDEAISSWWGGGVWVSQVGTFTAGCTGDVTINPPSVGSAANNNIDISVWNAGDVADPESPWNSASGARPIGSNPNGTTAVTFTLVEGQEYTLLATVWTPDVYEGQTFDPKGAGSRIEAACEDPETPHGPDAPGLGTGLWIDPWTGEVRVNQTFFVAFGAAAWIGSVVAGLATSKWVLP